MRIYTKAGDLAFEEITFPDGQPHFKLLTWEKEFRDVTIEMAFRSTADIFRAVMAASVLNNNSYNVNLDIRYLLGARMDRRIDRFQPETLQLVGSMLNSRMSFNRVRALDIHNPEAARQYGIASNVLPMGPVKQVLSTIADPLVIVPDKGARQRVEALTKGQVDDLVQCDKVRDPQTGRITNLKIDGIQRVVGRKVLIIDDICDGGATFTTLAMGLKDAGASEVHLFVTHLIASKGFKVFEGLIDRIFTTDSFRDWSTAPFAPVSCIRVRMENM